MPEVQNIFSEYGDAYESSHTMTFQQRKAFQAIKQCRTAALGSHVDECPDCGYQRPSYNSCRNRHCPRCQQMLKERWIENQSFDLLNIQYFHVVFTVPADLDPLFLSNQEKLYFHQQDSECQKRPGHIQMAGLRRWQKKIMTLSAMEFIRRFLLHVLPKGFMKIRHYGLLGNRNKTKKLTLCKRLTNTPIRPKEKLPTLQLIQKLIGHDITTCPVCGTLLRHSIGLPPPIVS